MATTRQYTAGTFGIEVDGGMVGFAKSVDGGGAFSDVVVEKIGADHVARKHLAGVKYEDITLAIGAGMKDGMYDWIAATFDRKYERKDGAVSFMDYRGAEQRRLSWFNGLITEVDFPKLDASSKDAASLTVKISPEYTRAVKGSSTKSSLDGSGSKPGIEKKWLPSNFRLSIPGVDCSRVNAIDALVVKQHVTEDAIGDERDLTREPGALEIPNLVVTLDQAHAGDFEKWFDDFVIKGNNDQSHEKEGKLEFLAWNTSTALFTLTMRGLGIFRMTPLSEASGSEKISRVKVEMYCEEMSFAYQKTSPAAVAPTPSGAQPAADGVAAVLVSALGTLVGSPVALSPRAPEVVAARLLATSDDHPTGSTVDPKEQGSILGTQWARERASLDELRQIAATGEREWTDLTLDEGHSLPAFLNEAGVVPHVPDDGLTLDRDPFVEGLVEGATAVYEEVQPHLEAVSDSRFRE